VVSPDPLSSAASRHSAIKTPDITEKDPYDGEPPDERHLNGILL
jgi:hypothetical protein